MEDMRFLSSELGNEAFLSKMHIENSNLLFIN